MSDLSNRQFVLTGGSGGIGAEVLLRLAKAGASVLIIGRSERSAQAAMNRTTEAVPGAEIDFFPCDLSLMREVERLGEHLNAHYQSLDGLIHCAGVMRRERTLTDEGLETVFAVQYLARHLLTRHLLDVLQAADNPQVINVSAGGEINMELDFDNLNGEKHYSGVNALQHESVANDMLTLSLAERVDDVTFYCYGPGYVRTDLMRDMPWWLRAFAATFGRVISISAGQAADHIMKLLRGGYKSGLYGRRAKHNTPSDFKANPANREKLWQMSDTMIQQALDKPPVG